MTIGFNRSTGKTMLIVVITLLVVTLITRTFPTAAPVKSWLGLS